MKILDCTLRDGGYYTNWDFDTDVVDSYIKTINNLPIDYVEIGYRSIKKKEYFGEFFYCPVSTINRFKNLCNKKLAIMLNEKDVNIEDLDELLTPIIGLVDLVRLAVNPKNFNGAVKIAEHTKKMGFEVGFNVMYLSTWLEQESLIDDLKNVNEKITYFNMVDSYGSVYPNYLKRIFKEVKANITEKVGFHGHNNLELGLINTLTAVECGADIVDATLTGIGRGAGNLKMELLLTVLNSLNKLELDYNVLSQAVDNFNDLHKNYGWGTNLPYMVSGANSLPQKEVMEWVEKRFYSFNSIIRALTNKSQGVKDNLNLRNFNPKNTAKRVLIIGGGPNGSLHSDGVRRYLESNKDVVIILASSKNVNNYEYLENEQIHCLSGNEGYRLEDNLKKLDFSNRMAILPPYPRMMGTYIPSFFGKNAFQLPEINFADVDSESVTAVAIQTAINIDAEEFIFVGYDGYKGVITTNEMELFGENEMLFAKLKEMNKRFYSLTPTKYSNLPVTSIYSLLK